MTKKIVSLLLTITICLSLITPALAAGVQATPDYSEEALRVSDEFASAYPAGSFNLGSVSVETHEYSGNVTFDIIRKGGSTGKVDVTIKAIDISAKIGLDYRITVPAFLSDRQIKGTDSAPLIESEQTEVVSTYNVGASTTADDITDLNGSYDTAPAAEAYDVDITPEQPQSSPRNGLRAARERATGVTSDRNKFSTPTKEESDALLAAAAAAEDFYAQAPGTEFTVVFGDGDRVRHFNMIIIDDDIPEWDEQVIFVITGVSGDGAVGLQKETTVNIIDNEPYEQPLIGFSASSYTAYGDTAEITLTRTSGVNYYAGANIYTVADSARPGEHYTELNQSILFIPGQTEMKITVPILKHDSSADKYFFIGLEPNESCSVYGDRTVRVRIPQAFSAASGFNMLMLSGDTEDLLSAAGDGSGDSVTLGVPYRMYGPNDFYFDGNSSAGRSKNSSYYEVSIEKDSISAGLVLDKGFRRSTLQSILATVTLRKIKKENNFDVWIDAYLISNVKKDITQKLLGKEYTLSIPTFSTSKNVIFGRNGDIQALGNETVFNNVYSMGNLTNDPFRIEFEIRNGNRDYAKMQLSNIIVNYRKFDFEIIDSTDTLYTFDFSKTEDEYTETTVTPGTIVITTDDAQKKKVTGFYTSEDSFTFNIETKDVLPGYYLKELRFYNSLDSRVAKYCTYDMTKSGSKLTIDADWLYKNADYSIGGSGSTRKLLVQPVFARDEVKLTISMTEQDMKMGSIEGIEFDESKPKYTVTYTKNNTGNKTLHAGDTVLLTGIGTGNKAVRSYYITIDGGPKTEIGVGDAGFLALTLPGDVTITPIFTDRRLDVKLDPDADQRLLGELTIDGQVSFTRDGYLADTYAGQMIDIAVRPPAGYTTQWANRTGDLNGNGVLDDSEIRDENGVIFRQYDFDGDGILDTEYADPLYGDFLSYKVNSPTPLYYYNFVPLTGQLLYSGPVTGHIVTREYDIRHGFTKVIDNKGEAVDKLVPVSGATVRMGGSFDPADPDSQIGYAATTNNSGKFSFNVSNVIKNAYYILSIDNNGSSFFIDKINPSVSGKNYILPTFTSMKPVSINAYPKNNEKNIVSGSVVMLQKGKEVSFVLVTAPLENNTRVSEAEFRVYSQEGTLKHIYLVDVTANKAEFKAVLDNTFDPNDRLAVVLIDQNGNRTIEYDTGFSFWPPLPASTLLPSFRTPLDVDIPLFNTVMGALDLGLAKLTETTIDEKNGATIRLGADHAFDEKEKVLKDTITKAEENNEDGKKARDEIKKENEEAKAEKKEDTNVKVKSTLTNKMSVSVSLEMNIKMDKNRKASEGSPYYFGHLYLMVTLNDKAELSTTVVLPIGLSVVTTLTIDGSVTGFLNITPIIKIGKTDPVRVYMDESGHFPYADSDMYKGSDYSLHAEGGVILQPKITLEIKGQYSVGEVAVKGSAEFFLVFTTDHNDRGTVKLNADMSVSVLGLEVYSKHLADWETSLFGNTSSMLADLSGDGAEDLTHFSPISRNYDERSGWLGADPLLQAGVPGLFTEVALRNGIYPYPDIQLMRIDDDSLLLVFVDDAPGRTAYNRAALYYSISHDNGETFSEPVLLADDGTIDSNPRLVDIGDKILCLYSSLDASINESTYMEEVLELNGLEMKFFNKNTCEFEGSAIDVTQYTGPEGDYYSDEYGNAVYDPASGKLLIIYSKMDYTSDEDRAFSAADLFDIQSTYSASYSTIAYRIYDTDSDRFLSYSDYGYLLGADPEEQDYWDEYWYGQGFLDTEIIDPGLLGGTLSDPLVYDLTTAVNNGVAYIAYTVDMDSNLSTAEDREIYMLTYTFATNSFTKAVKVSDIYVAAYDEEEAASLHINGKPQLIAYRDHVFLFYTSDSSIVYTDAEVLFNRLADPGSVPSNILLPAIAAEGDSVNDPSEDYKAIVGDDGKLYLFWTQDTLRLADGVEPGSQAALDESNAFHEHQIFVSVYYGDFGDHYSTTDETDLLTGVDSPVPDKDLNRWSGIIQITQGPGDYEDVCPSVMSDGSIIIAAKKSSQIQSPNHDTVLMVNDPDTAQLVSLTLVPEVMAVMPEDSISFSPSLPLSGDPVSITASFFNPSLASVDEPVVEFYAIKDGTEELIGTATNERTVVVDGTPVVVKNPVLGGEAAALSIEWTIPENPEGIKIAAILRNGSAGAVIAEAETDLPHGADLEIGLLKVDHVAQNYYRTYLEVSHNGNRTVRGAELVIYRVEPDETDRAVRRVSLPDVAAAESLLILDESFELPNSDLDPIDGVIGGSAKIRAAIENDGETIASRTGTVIKDVTALFGDMINAVDNVGLPLSSVSMLPGNRFPLKAVLSPDSAADGFEIVYRSSDPAIASISDDGTITALLPGSATITAYAVPKSEIVSLTLDGHRVSSGLLDYISLDDCKSGSMSITVFSVLPADESKDEGDEQTVDDPNTVSTTVKAVTDSSGKATVTVSDTQISQAIEKAISKQAQGSSKSPALLINIDAGADAKSIDAGITTASLRQMSDNRIGALTISSPIADITFDGNAIDGILEQSEEKVVITSSIVDKTSLPDAIRQTVGERPVFDFSVMSGSNTISQFSGNVTVSVPYTLSDDEDPNSVIIYYMNDSGELEIISNCSYDPHTGRVTFTTNHFSTFAVGYNKVEFSDVADTAWYAGAVAFAAARGITNGAGDGLFLPENSLTRGQFVTMLLRAYGIAPDQASADNFSDAGNTYYTGYLSAAKRLGVAGGIGNNRFAPERAVTRQEMAVMLYNALKVLNLLPASEAGKRLSDFSDSDEIITWAQEAFTVLVGNGIIKGSGGKLTPANELTRAEMAQIIYNLLYR